MKQRLKMALIFGALALGSAFNQAQAKDLTNRMGVGYQNQFGVDLPAVAVRYYPSPDLGVSAALGIDTEEDSSKFGFLVKVYRIIFKEDNMNFFMGAGGGLISREQNNSTDSGFELGGFAGGEFFLPGLDSLSFTFEAGVAVTSIANEVRFRTVGDHPLRAGITFYF